MVINGKAYSDQPMNTGYHALASFPCDTGERNGDNAHETPLPGQQFQNISQNLHITAPTPYSNRHRMPTPNQPFLTRNYRTHYPLSQ